MINGLQGLLQIDNVCSIKSTLFIYKTFTSYRLFLQDRKSAIRGSESSASCLAYIDKFYLLGAGWLFETVIRWKDNTLLALFAFENGLVSTLAMASQKLANGVQ